MSSESEDALDEIVISSSSFDLMHPPSSSPIHFCDNSAQSDDNSASPSAAPAAQPLRTLSGDGQENIAASSTSNQLTTDSCTLKNSKSRRMEYSMRGMKMSASNKSSQDSAFGSMTDGELSIASSSMRMNSFQSMSSPIDEGVEDSLSGMPGPLSRASTLNNENEPPLGECSIAQSASDLSLSKQKHARTANSSLSGSCVTIEPPTILVNDGSSSFYTTSPSKASSTVEVFSQKYRVSSFEDMSNKRALLKSVHKQNFRSLEEEQRIDSAFTPMGRHIHHRSFDTHRPAVNNAEKFKKLTHVAFARKISSTKERHTMWKNSILSRKQNLIKSNESLNESNKTANYFPIASGSRSGGGCSSYDSSRLHKRVSSTSELRSASRSAESDRGSHQLEEGFRSHPRKSSSERYLLNLSLLKHSAVGDYEEGDEDEANAIRLSEVECFIDESSSSSGYTNANVSGETVSGSGSSDSSPSHRSMCKIMRSVDGNSKCIEENVPLLDGMEMSPISPVENDEVL